MIILLSLLAFVFASLLVTAGALALSPGSESTIERRLGEGSRIDFTVLRAGIDPARRASLLETIHVAFTDVGLLHALNQSSGSISLHIPWDIPKDPKAITQLASSFELGFDAVNSNTFQDDDYKLGSLTNADPKIRQKPVEHHLY